MICITRSRGKVLLAAALFVIGLAIFVDDLHDFVPGTEWLHWLPDFTPVIIGGFHFEHLYWGIIIMVIALIVAARS
ncbi:MAG: hypothetical protein KAQ65_03005 [Candidatus Thorarchaeota archaeon]|nr:hypothetical protein [Candidatus Thorarchaeota archaeon]